MWYSTVAVEASLLHNGFSSNRQSINTSYTTLLIQTPNVPRDISKLTIRIPERSHWHC